MQTLPKKIDVVEVGPRDGFQNVKTFIPTHEKIAIIESLIASGVKEMEITSFVSPKAIPQMADASEIARVILGKYGNQIKASALVPNLRGAQLAWDAGIREITCVMSVSVAHNKANVNRTHEESLEELARMRKALPDMKMRVDLATVFACPFDGWVRKEEVAELTRKVIAQGINKLVLCDTIGVATPDRVYEVSQYMIQNFPNTEFSLHLHDTRGLGLANTLAGLMAGITSYETSIAGLGGCPFAPGAAGNTATEDMLNMLESMNIETEINLDKFLMAVKQVEEKVDAALTSRMATAKLYGCLNS